MVGHMLMLSWIYENAVIAVMCYWLVCKNGYGQLVRKFELWKLENLHLQTMEKYKSQVAWLY